jgi:hypothetical protein
MTEHEENLRDLAAMFAMAALLTRNSPKEAIVSLAFEMADMFMQARVVAPEDGIAAIKPTKRKEPK